MALPLQDKALRKEGVMKATRDASHSKSAMRKICENAYSVSRKLTDCAPPARLRTGVFASPLVIQSSHLLVSAVVAGDLSGRENEILCRPAVRLLRLYR